MLPLFRLPLLGTSPGLRRSIAPVLLVVLALLPLVERPLQAQGPSKVGEIAFRQALLDASTDTVVLNFAAHPDDESARTMVYLRNRFGVRTVTAYATCGEGGQNAIGRAIGRELAAIRARETLAAAARYGTKVHWLGFPDFGFSKSLEETREVWGAEEVLARFGALLDEVKPDVVITNHSIDRGHGHHRTVAWALQQLCPEKGIPLYERYAAQFDGDDREEGTESVPGVFEFEVGAVDPLRGATFARQAHEAWVLHESQGPWRDHDPTRVSNDRWLQVWPDREESPRTPLGWNRPLYQREDFRDALKGLDHADVVAGYDELGGRDDPRLTQRIHEQVYDCLRELRARLVERGLQGLVARVDRRLEAVGRVLAFARGFGVEIFQQSRSLAFGQESVIRVRPLGLSDRTDPGDSSPGLTLDDFGLEHLTLHLLDLRLDGASVPREPDESGFLPIPLRLPDSARSDPVVDLTRIHRFKLSLDLMVGDIPVTIDRQIAVEVLPEAEVKWSRDAAFVPTSGPFRRAYSLEVSWRGEGTLDTPVVLRAPEAFQVEAFPKQVQLDETRRTARVTVRVERSPDVERALGDQPFSLQARVGEAGAATIELRPFEVPNGDDTRPVGLVRGPEDTTERFLEDLGVPFVNLDETGLAVADFSEFRTIVLDIRAYHHRPELADHRERLFEYCRAGGRIVCFYHKPREWNEAPGRPSIAPFSIKTSRLRVSEEDAVVEFLQPEHPLWNRPFAIGTEDFDGWVQERGLNFPSERDEAWVPLLVSHDEGEDPLDSALLYAPYGEGDYVYCSLALYRQLRRAHPGAARIALNLFLGR
ncbi:MAG: PIG-L family deacetylase [Planctomycetota bacterium]